MFLGFAIFLGAILRLANVLPYKFYPDAYQNLLVAENLHKYGTVVHTLGDGGYLFPPLFMWSRPVYPILINIVKLFLDNPEASANLISIVSGILTIPMAYLLVSRIFSSKKGALGAAFLTAVSFNHTVWSSLIMSEAVGVFCLFFIIILLIDNLDSQDYLNKKDLLLGIIMGIGFFTRYEYVVLLLPIAYLIVNSSPRPEIKILNIFSSCLFISSIIFSSMFPVHDSIIIFYNQSKSIFKENLILWLLIIFFIFNIRGAKKIITFLEEKINKYKGIIVTLVGITLLAVLVTHLTIPRFPAVSGFIRNDFLLVLCGFFGISIIGSNKKYRNLLTFCLLSIFLFVMVYHSINPAMERYMTYILPFVVIPAGYFFSKVPLYTFFYIPITIAFIAQINKSYIGIKSWNNGDWTRTSYEETAAKKVGEFLKEGDVIAGAFPEPYYFYNHKTVVGIYNAPPFIDFEKISENSEIVIINDVASKDIFPNFYDFVNDNLKSYKIGQFFTNRNYRYKSYSLQETIPVEVYRIKLWVFKNLVEKK